MGSAHSSDAISRRPVVVEHAATPPVAVDGSVVGAPKTTGRSASAPMTTGTTAAAGDTVDPPRSFAPSSETASTTTTTAITYHDANRPEGGMALVHYVCRKKKRNYEKCVSSWYAKEFMTGAGSLNQEEVCGEKFEFYKACVLKGIRKEVWDKQGLSPPSDGSPLAIETAEDTLDDDTTVGR